MLFLKLGFVLAGCTFIAVLSIMYLRFKNGHVRKAAAANLDDHHGS